MTDLDAIRARDAEFTDDSPRWQTLNGDGWEAVTDRRALLAEGDWLRAERSALAELAGVIDAERARIRAAVEGLPVQSLVGMTGDASVDNYVDRAAVLAVLAVLAEYDR